MALFVKIYLDYCFLVFLKHKQESKHVIFLTLMSLGCFSFTHFYIEVRKFMIASLLDLFF